ncbi:MAG: alpha/beta fold hydrolase [Gammaproteobacteria bacterium]
MDFTIDGQGVYAAGSGAGEGERLILLVHGAAMDHTVWTYHTRYFSHVGAAVAAVDLPGHGRSAGAPLESIEAMADWLAACLDHFGAERAAVAGHSMGSLAALELAARAGARVERLALLGCAVPMAVSDMLLDAARADKPVARDMMMLWGHGPQAVMGGNPIAGIVMLTSAMRLLERAAPGVLFTDLNACNAYAGGLDAAARVTAATRLVCGAEDRMTPNRAARELAGHIQDCRMDVIPACGHILMSEQPEHTHRCLVEALL